MSLWRPATTAVHPRCGQLAQMALLYAHLGASRHAELEQISRAMLAHPDLVAGDGRFDTEQMRQPRTGAVQGWCRRHSVSESGWEGSWGCHQGGGWLAQGKQAVACIFCVNLMVDSAWTQDLEEQF